MNPTHIKQNTVCIILIAKHFRQDKDKRKKIITIQKPFIQGHRPNIWVYILPDFCLYMYMF